MKSKFPISGLLIGQVVAMFVGIIGLFYLMSGPIAALTLPQLATLSPRCRHGCGGASISIATSDAATIAIVVSAKARGPMTTNIVRWSS